MATISQAPVPIIAGTSTPVLPPSQSTPYGTIVCTVYNSTPNVLAVTCAGGARYLQPNQADSYPTSSAMPIPTVSPFTTLPNGTFLGTITATFYDKNDGAPPGFPMPLTPFPGGAVLMVGSTSTVGTISNIGFSFTATTPATVAIVPGAGSITFNWVASPLLTPVNFTITGNNSGTSYATVTTQGVSTVNLIGNFFDTALVFACALGTVCIANVYEGPALGVPQFATKSVAIPATTAAALPALTSGAYYLLGADFINGAASSMYGEIGDSISTFAAFACQGTIAGNDGPNSVALNGYRTIGPVAVTYLLGSGTGAAFLRYALGP